MTAGGFGRALRYFVRQAEIYVLCAVGGGFLMAAYIWLLSGYDKGLWEILETVPNSIAYIAMIILFTSGISSVQYWYSLPVSFGCIRKNAFWGNLIMDLLVIAETGILYIITANLFHTDMTPYEFAFGFAAFLLLEGISRFLGIAAFRWGKAVYVIMIIVIVACSMSIGFLVGYAGVSGILISVTDILGESIVRNGQWILLTIGAAFCVVGNTACWRILRVFEVKV